VGVQHPSRGSHQSEDLENLSSLCEAGGALGSGPNLRFDKAQTAMFENFLDDLLVPDEANDQQPPPTFGAG
jgi:hypothetical protein